MSEPARKIILSPAVRPKGKGVIRVALVGAGQFAKAVHLPLLGKLKHHYHLQSVVARSGHNAKITGNQFGANYVTTDYQEVLDDPDVDAIVILTRHNLHAHLALQGLRAGKHVFVEKPLALTDDELQEIKKFYDDTPEDSQRPVLLTGYNRRFSPYAQRMRAITAKRSNPMILNYRMNAGYVPLDHWVHTDEGGGRNLGEACHIYDLFTFFTDSLVTSVNTKLIRPTTGYYSARDNFVTTMTFEDGSVATLTYTALGTALHPKEQMDIYVDNKVLALNDYKGLKIPGGGKGLKTRQVEKGHKEEMEAFAGVINGGGNWPIPLWQQIQATEIALMVEEQLGSGS